MLLATVIEDLGKARSFGDIASALNMSSSFLTRCCMLEFEFEGEHYRLYPTEVEAYCHSALFPDPYTHCHELQRNRYGKLYFHGAGMDICLSTDDNYLSFLLRSAYVVRIVDGISQHHTVDAVSLEPIPVVGPIRLREAVFGKYPATHLRALDVADQMILREADTMTIPDRFYTMIAPRIGLNPETDKKYVDLRLRTVSDATMRKRDYRPKEALLDSYLEIVKLTPKERYLAAKKLVDRCPSKYIVR